MRKRRREVLVGCLGAAITACARPNARPETETRAPETPRDAGAAWYARRDMRSFVLVHGANLGSWNWKEVRPLVWAAGHAAYTPSLTGLGERRHLVTPDTGLETHIQDVLAEIENEELDRVVLVGHSYGGMIAAGVADRIPDKIAHVVFLDAAVPVDGESMESLGFGKGRTEPMKLPPEMEATPLVQEIRRHFAPQPPKTYTDKIRITKPLEERPFARTFIKCTEDPKKFGPNGPDNPLWLMADRVKGKAGWRYLELATIHNAPRTKPRELTQMLLELA